MIVEDGLHQRTPLRQNVGQLGVGQLGYCTKYTGRAASALGSLGHTNANNASMPMITTKMNFLLFIVIKYSKIARAKITLRVYTLTW